SRERRGGSGHTDDTVTPLADTTVIFDGLSVLNAIPPINAGWIKPCFATLHGEWPAVHDAAASSTGPWCAVIGLSHTTDPLNYIPTLAFPGVRTAQAAIRAPRKDTTFPYEVFSPSLPPRQGGPPNLDIDRYAALSGKFQQASIDQARDYSVLLSCGPFRTLA